MWLDDKSLCLNTQRGVVWVIVLARSVRYMWYHSLSSYDAGSMSPHQRLPFLFREKKKKNFEVGYCNLHVHIYIYVCVCVCIYTHTYILVRIHCKKKKKSIHYKYELTRYHSTIFHHLLNWTYVTWGFDMML